MLRDTRRARREVKGQAADLARLRLRLIDLAKQASEDRDRADVLRNALLRKQADQLARRDGAQSRLATVRARIASLERQQAENALRNSGAQGATEQAPPRAERAAGPGRRRGREGHRGRERDRDHARTSGAAGTAAARRAATTAPAR